MKFRIKVRDPEQEQAKCRIWNAVERSLKPETEIPGEQWINLHRSRTSAIMALAAEGGATDEKTIEYDTALEKARIIARNR